MMRVSDVERDMTRVTAEPRQNFELDSRMSIVEERLHLIGKQENDSIRDFGPKMARFDEIFEVIERQRQKVERVQEEVTNQGREIA